MLLPPPTSTLFPYTTLFRSIPGLKVALPSGPYEAKGLMKTAIRDDSPVVIFEDKMMYRSEEHTSELQSRPQLVCRLLLEKKKKDHRSTRLSTSAHCFSTKFR